MGLSSPTSARRHRASAASSGLWGYRPLIPASKADAAQLEALRSGLAPLLSWLEALPTDKAIPRADVAVAWTFTTSAANEALFDPTAGLLPFPNDVLIDQTTGKVALPISPSDPAAVQAIKGGLNTLDGFSNNGPATTAFSLPLDPATVTLIPDLTGVLTLSNPIGVADITTVDPSNPDTLTNLVIYGPDVMTVRYDQGQLVVQNVSGDPLPPKHRYMVILFDGLKSAGTDPLPIHVSPVFWMARNELPLVDGTGKSQMPSTLSDADAAQLEQLRLAYSGIFDALAGLGIGREKVLGFFTFTTGTTPRTCRPWQPRCRRRRRPALARSRPWQRPGLPGPACPRTPSKRCASAARWGPG